MEYYPRTDIDPASYTPAPSAGAQLIVAENGTPWIYEPHDKPRTTFEIVHPALLDTELAELRQFYTDHRKEHVIFTDPFTGLEHVVMMLNPPAVANMATIDRANVRITLVEV